MIYRINPFLYSFVLINSQITFEEVVKQLDTATLTFDWYLLSGWDGPAGLISVDTSWDAVWQKLEPAPAPIPDQTDIIANITSTQTSDFTILLIVFFLLYYF